MTVKINYYDLLGNSKKKLNEKRERERYIYIYIKLKKKGLNAIGLCFYIY